MTKQRIAGIISAIFDPLVEGLVLLPIIFLTKSRAPLSLLGLLVLIDVLLPYLFLRYGMKKGFITDWETTNRHERHGFNFVCLLSLIFSFFLVFFFGDQFLVKFFLIFLILMGVYSLITVFWKISGHMASNTAFFLILNNFFDWRFWWLVFLLPLVAWARLIRNKHDFWQVLAGVILASLVILWGTSFLF